MQLERQRNHNFKDLSGERFGRLVVQRFAGRNKHDKALWECLCECGAQRVVVGCDLRRGDTRSCNCLKNEFSALRRYRHGGTGSPTYESWAHMIQRCTNPKHTGYRNWGGRGITCCQRWLNFENFYADMGERPPGTSIDRFPDPDGNYEPGNCRWATASQQQNNKRPRQKKAA